MFKNCQIHLSIPLCQQVQKNQVLEVFLWYITGKRTANMVILKVAEITKHKDFRLSNLSDEAWVLF